MVRGFPAPSEHPSPATYTPAGGGRRTRSKCDPHGPLVAEVVKTTSDPYVCWISLVRVFSGTLEPDRPVHVSGHLTSFFVLVWRRRPRRRRAGGCAVLPVRQPRCSRPSGWSCGDIATVGRLTRAETGDTLSLGRGPAGAAPVVAAQAAAAGGDRGRHPEVRRGGAVHRALPAVGRGPVPCGSRWRPATRRTRALDDGRGGSPTPPSSGSPERFGVSVSQVEFEVGMRETLRAPGNRLWAGT